MHLYWESLSDFQSSPKFLANPKNLTSYYEIEPPVAAPLASHYEIELLSALPLTSYYEIVPPLAALLTLHYEMESPPAPPLASHYEIESPLTLHYEEEPPPAPLFIRLWNKLPNIFIAFLGVSENDPAGGGNFWAISTDLQSGMLSGNSESHLRSSKISRAYRREIFP